MKAAEINSAIEAGAVIAGAYFIISAIFGYKKRKLEEQRATEGIGATKPKRRIWQEIEAAQNQGIDLTDPNGWQGKEKILLRMSQGKLSKSNSSKSDEERYFGQLRRAYKSIAGTGLPYNQSVVRNEYGDVILVYNDYHLDKLPQIAADWCEQVAKENANDPEGYGYWATVAAIAKGKKFVWASKGEHRGIEKLIFGHSAPAERKQRISYLASPEKGGSYPEKWAHHLWEANDSQQDDQMITDGVLTALLDITSVGHAQQMCIDQYLQAHQATEPLLYGDMPF